MQKQIILNLVSGYPCKRMRIWLSYFYTLILLILLNVSCNDANAPDCFKKTGEYTEQEFMLDSFHTVVVLDEADVYLANGVEQLVEIRSGKNLIPDIHLEVKDSVLTIRNENSCNWRRMPGNPGIYINSNRLRRIEIYDYANFYTMDTLSLSRLTVFSDGTGNFDMAIDMDSLYVKSIYISNFRFSGSVEVLEVTFEDDSRFDGAELTSDFNKINHFGSNLIEIFPLKELVGELGSTGDLCYHHEPEYIDVKIDHTGRLIKCSE